MPGAASAGEVLQDEPEIHLGLGDLLAAAELGEDRDRLFIGASRRLDRGGVVFGGIACKAVPRRAEMRARKQRLGFGGQRARRAVVERDDGAG